MADAVSFYLFTKGKVVIFYTGLKEIKDIYRSCLSMLPAHSTLLFYIYYLLVVLQHVLSRTIAEKHSESSARQKR